MSAARGNHAPIDPGAMRRVLVVKPDHVGDLMLAIPALARLRARFPGARIDVLGRPDVHAFTVAHGLADRVLPFDSPWLDRVAPRVEDWPRIASLVAALRQERYDLAVNLRHDFRDLLLTALCGAAYRLSYDHRGLARWVTHSPGPPDPDGHETERWTRLLEFAGIPEADDFRPRIGQADREAAARVLAPLAAGRPRVAVHVRSRRAAKNWPAASWVSLLRAITGDLNASVVLVGSADDREAHAALLAEHVVDAAGAFELATLPALLAECRALVGVDSGPAHLAARIGLPTVVIFSGVDLAARWRPAGERVEVLENAVPCAPCRLRECDVPGHPCMAGIGADAVARALGEALR